MSMAAIKATAAAKTTSKRRPAAKCTTLVRKRDVLDKQIKAIERKNAEDLKREQDKILKRHDAQHKKVDGERDKALKQLADKFGKACVVRARKPRSDKGKKASKRASSAANDAPTERPPAAKTTAKKVAKKPAAKKAAKKVAKAGKKPAGKGGQQSLACDGC